MPLETTTFELDYARGVRLTVTPQENRNYKLVEVECVARGDVASHFFDNLRKTAEAARIPVNHETSQFDDLFWEVVKLPLREFSDAFQTQVRLHLQQVLNRVVADIWVDRPGSNFGAHKVEPRSTVRLFVTDESGTPVGPWFWNDRVREVVTQ